MSEVTIPKVSIIVPVYNAGKYLNRCLDSLINQTYRNIEIVLVNDGSSDNSGEICDNYAQHDSRITVFHKENEGAGLTRNKGLELSRGEYIYFIDADDWLELTCIEKSVFALNKETPDILVFGYRKISPDNKTISTVLPLSESLEILDSNRTNIFTKLNLGTGHAVWNKIFRSNFLEENNLQFKKTKRVEDFIFLIEAYNCVSKISAVGEVLHNYQIIYNSKNKFSESIIEDHILNFNLLTDFVKRFSPTDAKDVNRYELKIFNLWFAIVIPINIYKNESISQSQKKHYVAGLFNNEDFNRFLKMLKPESGNKKDWLTFKIIQQKSSILLFLFAALIVKLRKIPH
ncbi:MAG: glycosyltransferase [Paludibacter sp.]|nr:glycosyltransferase [Paludibacter sp.]